MPREKTRKVTLQPFFPIQQKQKTKFFRFIPWMEYYHHHSSYRSSCFSFFLPRTTLYCRKYASFEYFVGFFFDKINVIMSSSCDVSLMNLVYHKFFINMVLIFFRYRFFWLLVFDDDVCVIHSTNWYNLLFLLSVCVLYIARKADDDDENMTLNDFCRKQKLR